MGKGLFRVYLLNQPSLELYAFNGFVPDDLHMQNAIRADKDHESDRSLSPC